MTQDTRCCGKLNVLPPFPYRQSPISPPHPGNLSEFVKVKPEAKTYYELAAATLRFKWAVAAVWRLGCGAVLAVCGPTSNAWCTCRNTSAPRQQS